LIQGMRRIADLAKMSVLGALFGTAFSVPLAYFYREKGVVPSLVAIAATAIVTSWWYSRKIKVATTPMKVSEMGHEAGALLKLGLAFMSSGLITLGVAYVVRITVLHQLGLAATGFYQSAWNLGGLYVGFILQAMAADFYPRLTTRAHDNTACNRLVNEQTRVGMLLAGPGVIATLTFAPVVIALFYSAKFGAAVGILRWICLGTMLQVITWPMGFIIVAKGKNRIFFLSELAWGVVSLALAWSCITYFHLNGAGMAFFGSYVFHGFLIYPIVRRLTGFRWSADNKRTGALFLSATAIVFCTFYILPLPWAFGIGTLIGVATGVYSARALIQLVPTSEVPAFARKLLVLFRLAPAAA
jgi:antigen flippase